MQKTKRMEKRAETTKEGDHKKPTKKMEGKESERRKTGRKKNEFKEGKLIRDSTLRIDVQRVCEDNVNGTRTKSQAKERDSKKKERRKEREKITLVNEDRTKVMYV